jgi:hypothetical protein
MEDRKIILVDLNQVMLSNMLQLPDLKNNVDTNLFRHMTLNKIRTLRNTFSQKYGEFVICCDDKNYWRKDIFPYYKAHRKKDREASSLDWNMIFNGLNQVRDELKEVFPYRVLHIDRAEADDLIAAMCKKHGVYLNAENTEKILILSSDKDFLQLQKYANVEQYSPGQKKFVRHNQPHIYIREHIIRGDRGDGIPNLLSDDDTFVVKGKKQKRLSSKKVDEWLQQDDPQEWCDDKMLRGYMRNQALVDLDRIPDKVYNGAINMYENYQVNSRDKLFNYFIQHKLKNLMEHIGDF